MQLTIVLAHGTASSEVQHVVKIVERRQAVAMLLLNVVAKQR